MCRPRQKPWFLSLKKPFAATTPPPPSTLLFVSAHMLLYCSGFSQSIGSRFLLQNSIRCDAAVYYREAAYKTGASC